MAHFIGTSEEFNQFLGPFFRNKVQLLSKKYKKEVGQCEICGDPQNLEAAHRKGKERKEIINKLIEKYFTSGYYNIDISEFTEKFAEEHKSLNQSFLILCKRCHHQYDKNPNIETNIITKSPTKTNNNKTRIFSNKEIQMKISKKLEALDFENLKVYLDKEFSKKVFNLNYPLLKKIKEKDTNIERKKQLSENGVNRWSLKFGFTKEGYRFAICTQWYGRNDEFVEKWLKDN